ncbi:MAG TPA: aminotransferase class I/II-fold pyridoxal phosphate-dependent enzyme, partial [Candidatus Nitrosotenuis sp.]|nr:aminotransferase class I/II-fold pyridoxal phosphate-dependent enzyme [Candidatus Nitrosotenuis sp.]
MPGFRTLAIHAGQEPEPWTGAVTVPIFQTSTFAQEGLGRPRHGYEYARTDNPTRRAYETCVAALEGGRFGVAFASGLAATHNCLQLLRAGDHLVVSDDVYGGTYRLFSRVMEKFGLETSYVDTSDLSAVARALQPNTRMVWVETPTNPLLKLTDLRAVADLAHRHGAWLAVDNTFATPCFQRPLELGADIVVHSATKYLGGHSDVVGGVLVTNDPQVHEVMRFHQNAVGAVPGPFDCWLVLRGVKTLALRMQAHEANALALARWLEAHPRVRRVFYPGLPSHPQHALARRQMSGFGGMISFEIDGGLEEARRLLEATHLFF